MILEAAHPTESYLEGRMTFHLTQAQWFNTHNLPLMALWANVQAEAWQKKLEDLRAKKGVQ